MVVLENSGGKHNKYLPRKCSACDEGQMFITKTWQSSFEPMQKYECGSCKHTLEIPSVGYIGLQLFVALIVGPALIWLFLIDDNYPSIFSYVIILGLVGAYSFFTIANVVVHFSHPYKKIDPTLPKPVTIIEYPRSFMAKLMNRGLLLTPLFFLLSAIVILAIAGTIGYVSDYVL